MTTPTIILDSSSDEFGTPQVLFSPLHEEFGFSIDAAASDLNHKCSIYFTKEADALSLDWMEVARTNEVRPIFWCNPPYSRGNVKAFVEKAYEMSKWGATTVLLLPCRTEQDWFHDIVLPNAEVRFLRGRVQFEGGATSARFPSMLVIFRPPTQSWTKA